MVGAAAGGFWCELAFERLTSPAGDSLDLAAFVAVGLLTLAIAWMVWRAGGRVALPVYLVVTGVAATLGPALVF